METIDQNKKYFFFNSIKLFKSKVIIQIYNLNLKVRC